MEYKKVPLTFEDQIKKLQKRGLIISNEALAKNYLSNISYYRLRAYTYPFQENLLPSLDHKFLIEGITFEEIIDLYCFDRRLRSLLINAIEKIEVSIRTKIVYEYSVETEDSHWFLNEDLFFDKANYIHILSDIEEEINRSNEDFIIHYKKTYSTPYLPPSWMTLEVLSFGTLSRFFKLLDKNHPANKKIVNNFGLPNSEFLSNWMHSFSVLRNYCAHHSRIWNRRFTVNMKLPYNTIHPFIDRSNLNQLRNNKIFAVLSCLKYLLNIISPNCDFKNNLISIINTGGRLLDLEDMGFPQDWKELDVWKN